MARDLLWNTTIEEIRGLRRDVQELLAIMKETRDRAPESGESPTAERAVRPMLTIAEVADLLRTSPKAVYTLIERGRVPGVVRLGRKILVRRDQLGRALAKGGLA